MNQEEFLDKYVPLYEIGLIEPNMNPAVKVASKFAVCPTMLAALMVTLFETAIKDVEESKQIDFEKNFHKSFKLLMKTRHDYDICYKYVKAEDEEDTNGDK